MTRAIWLRRKLLVTLVLMSDSHFISQKHTCFIRNWDNHTIARAVPVRYAPQEQGRGRVFPSFPWEDKAMPPPEFHRRRYCATG